MQSIKQKITQQFNRAASSYDQVAGVQLKCAKYLVNNLIQRLQPNNINTILDLGTGTGYVPNLLIKNYPDSLIDLNDIAGNMLAFAAQALPRVNNLLLGDMEQLNFGEYDLITSNLSLQWVENLEKMLIKLYFNSRFLGFSCLLVGTFKEWLDQFNNLRSQFPMCKYPTAKKLKQLLLSLQPQRYWCGVKDYTIRFNDAVQVMQYLKDLGATTSSDVTPFAEIKKLLKSSDPIGLTYKVFFGMLERGNKGD